jgi:hypothetical protein
MQTNYLQIMDDILNFFYDKIGQPLLISNFKNDFKINENLFFACIEKIHRNSHIDKLNNERAEKAICQINLDGILFKESGGYIEKERINLINNQYRETLENIRRRNERLIVRGTWGIASGAIALVVWEMYKTFCLHIR